MSSAADTQPYDGSIKTIFKNDAANILPHLLPGTIWQETLDIEVLRSPMRVDRVYRVLYRGKVYILHLEFQASTDSKMAHRLLIYHANVWNDHKHPVITIVIYLFKSSVPTSPLQEFGENDEEILTFHFKVMTLWTETADYYMKHKLVSVYPLLPAMEYTDTAILLKAIDEMVEYYQGDETELSQQLLWFKIFLARTDTIPEEEKKKVEERLDVFEQILEESSYVQKQRAIGEAKGEAKTLRKMLVKIVTARYPALTELAQEYANHTQQVEKLDELITTLSSGLDEGRVRFLLNRSKSS
jgi:hypothetical protein